MSITDVFHPTYFDAFTAQRTKTSLRNEYIKANETMQTVIKTPRSRPVEASANVDANINADAGDALSPRPSLQHVIFLDYDDTLLPTDYLLSFIEYEVAENADTKQKTIKTFALHADCSPDAIKQFVDNMERAGTAAYNLLLKIFAKFSADNIKIVTNGEHGWLPESLKVVGSFCEAYRKIEHLLFREHQVEIIYARDRSVKCDQWKTRCFDRLLWQYFHPHVEGEQPVTDGDAEDAESINLNLITIGDQWTDHTSIAQSLSFSVYGECMNHHQIKLVAKPDARYFCVELDYVSKLLDEDILFRVHSNEAAAESGGRASGGVVLEFDGYND